VVKKAPKKTSPKKKTALKSDPPTETSSGLQVERVPVDTLTIDAENARTHSDAQIEHLMASLQEFGQFPTILVGSDDVIIKGNGTYEAAKRLGLQVVDVIRIPLSGAAARAYSIADNRLGDESDWDLQKLEEQLAELQKANWNLEAIGWDSQALADILQWEIDGIVENDPAASIPPEQFPEIGEDLKTEHECPKCGYKWSGQQT